MKWEVGIGYANQELHHPNFIEVRSKLEAEDLCRNVNQSNVFYAEIYVSFYQNERKVRVNLDQLRSLMGA